MNPLRFPSRALRLIGPADREPAAASRKPLRRATHLRSLEQRFMFDGAAVGDAAHAVANHDAAVHDVVVPAAVEVRTADPAKDSGRKEVVFVDTSVSGYKTLEAGIPAGMSIVEIDGSQNGLAQIANWAQTHTGFDAIHILSHGTEGMLELGTAFVNDAALHSSGTQAELADIGHALKSGGDLLLYGCDVATGSDGRQFVDDLSAATGHDVAASTDATGAAAKGGNWTLEAQVGHIDAATLDIGSYTDTLGNVVTGNDPGAAYSNTNTIAPSAPTDLAQSFTATKTGLLTTLTLYGTLPSGTATLNVYSGDGTGGALLETQSLSPFNAAGIADTGNNRYIATNITLTTPVNITNGNVYTFQITTNDGISLTYTNNADYAGGTLYDTGTDQGSSYDLMFDATQADANSAPSNTVAPAVSGTQTVGNVVSATTGTWNDADGDPLTFSYQWYRADDSSGTNAAAIAGATGSSYTLTTSDAHEYVRVVVTADDGNSHTPTANSSWTAVNDAAPANSVAPSLSGTATVGNALSATTGTWSDADGDSLTYSYQWYRADDGSGTNAVAIGGATGSSYTLTSSDGNEFVRVVVTANDGHGSSNQTGASGWTSVATVPSVSSVVRTGGASSTVDASDSSISYTVTFSESVTGVDASDFSLTETGTASGSIASVSGSGTTYTVTVDTLSGDGTMRLDLNGSGTGIQNGSSVDIAGGYTSGATYTVDHTAPNAPSTPDMSAGTDTGSSNTDNITDNTTPTFTGTAESGSTVTLYDTDGTTVLGTTTATGGSWSITSSSLSDGSHTLTAKSTDAAGNVSSASSGLSVTIDATAPVVSSVSVPSDGAYKAGDNLDFTVNLSEAVVVDTSGGTPRVALTIGSSTVYADYVAGSGSSALVFRYTVQAGDSDANGITIGTLQSNGGTLTDVAGNGTTLTLNSVGSTASVLVDTTAPTVTDGNITISGGSGTGGAYKIGDTVTATWNDTAGGDNNSDNLGVTVDFSAFGGGSAVAATDSGGTWTATYTITSGAIDATNRNVSVTATDSAGNTTTTADTSNATVDSVALTATDGNITISGGSGTGGAYKIGDTVTATWNNTAGGDNNSDTISAVTVDFSAFGGGSAVTATNSGGTWTATYTLTVGAINGAAGRNVSVSVVDNAGNATSTADTTNATVDNAAPTVTVGNIALSNDTGSSNTDFVTNTSSQTITATLSSALSGSDVVYGSLDNGATWSDITSQVSGTTLSWAGVSLAGSNTLQLKVTDGAGNDGSIASQAYTLDSTAPGTPSAPHLSSGSDTGSSSSDGITGDTTPTFTGTAEAGSTVTLYDTDGTTVLGTTTATGGNWSITSGALSSGSHTVSATATDAAGNVFSVSSGPTVTIDSTAPAVTSVSGPADGSYKAGDTLSFTVDTGEAVTVDTSGGAPRIAVVIGNATVYATYASGSGSNALVFHYTVQPGDIDTDGITVGSLQANGATLRDTAGNDMDLTLRSVGSTAAVRVGDSATPPSITIGHLALSADTGASSADFVTRTASQTVTATLSAALGGGDKVYGSLDNGATWTELTSHVSGTSLTWSGVTLVGTNTLQLKVTDGAGNDGAVASHAYTLDTTPPVAPVADAQATTSTAPTLTGTASLGAVDTLTVAVGGASYRVTPGSDGHWQLDLSSATPISGTLALASGSRYAVTATTTDVAGNTSTATASLDILVPPITTPVPVPAPVPAPLAVEAPSAPAAAPGVDAPPPVPAPISFLSPAVESVLATNPVSAALSPTLSPVSLVAPDYTAVTHALLDPAASAQADAPFMLTRGDANSFRVVVTSAGNDGATGEALLLNRGMSDQSLQASGSGEISVPADAFAHTDPNATIQLSARQADGQPLPQWIAFDPHTGKFEVHAPHGVDGDVVIKLVAHDAQGHEATAVFKIHLGGKRNAAHVHALATPSARASLSEQVRMAARAHTPIAALERLAEGHPDAREVPWPNA